MALKSTIYKAELEIVDMDRNYYATHKLTAHLGQPSLDFLDVRQPGIAVRIVTSD